ncbi:hypothetical protein [Paenibacillus sp. GP183]|uniref:hypothetical protein n=1 Tax=Paenibacillus sp. GP183 TaxID=1882751 RepID=UPI000894A402|nr:hypothetical protein [Paenibacillus sp. GP183]SEC29406.1 hypothetical protein SAMN05443246_3612 [Paenibacillus sp. GP183]
MTRDAELLTVCPVPTSRSGRSIEYMIGKLVFLEYMIAQDDFVKGVNHVNLGGMKGVPSPAVVQLDVEFQPHGHSGFEVPRYSRVFYFRRRAAEYKINETNGVSLLRNMKLTPFVSPPR